MNKKIRLRQKKIEKERARVRARIYQKRLTDCSKKLIESLNLLRGSLVKTNEALIRFIYAMKEDENLRLADRIASNLGDGSIGGN